MLFSGKEITKLLIDAVENENLDIDALCSILYFLHLSNEEIPLIIAEKILDLPELVSNQDILGKRIAFVHVKDLSEIRNFEIRNSKQVKICRQLNRIGLFLEENKAPASILFDFSKLSKSLISSLFFFENRQQNEASMYAAEEVLVIEQLIESIILSKELSLRFYEELFTKLGKIKSHEVASILIKRISQALSSKTKLEELELIINPNSNININKNLESHAGFSEALNNLSDFLEKKLLIKASLH